jgi:ribosomal protein L19
MMPQFKSGETVIVKEGLHQGKKLRVVEVKGSVLLLEDFDGQTTELFQNQVRKGMLLG